MSKYILLDTETTGTTQEDRIIQLGYIVLENGSKKAEVRSDFCKPSLPIKVEAMEVHNITPDIIENSPKCSQADSFKKLNELNIQSNYLVVHNLSFDVNMLAKDGFENQMRTIDTLRCAKHIYPELQAHRLQYLRYKLELYKDEQQEAQKLGVKTKAHDALGDVLIMKMLLSDMTKRIKEQFKGVNPIEKMVELTKTPVLMKKFRFGKYKDRDIADVVVSDKSYAEWMLRSMELDEDMKYSLEYFLKQRKQL